MSSEMSGKRKCVLIIAFISVVALLAAFWAFTFEPTSMWAKKSAVQGDLELFYKVRTIVTSVNAAILVVLLFMYVSIFKKTQSEFTIGLIVFSLVLLLYALMSNPIMQYAFGFKAFGLGPFAMLPDLFTTIALVVLLYLTLK